MHRSEDARGPRGASPQNKEAPPLGQQRRGQSLNDQNDPDKESDMDSQPSTPSVTETPMPGEDIDNLLLRCDGEATTVPPYVPVYRPTQASILETALALEAAGISVVPLDADGNPTVDITEYQKRRATPDEIRAWFGPESAPGAP